MQSEKNKIKYKFSKLSLERLATCHTDLQDLVNYVMGMQMMDFSVLCGFRNKTKQDNAFNQGFSKLKWPQSHHNKQPSLAVDLCAYPIDNFSHLNSRRTEELAGYVLMAADKLRLPVTWGGNWRKFKDIYHFQLPEDWPNV